MRTAPKLAAYCHSISLVRLLTLGICVDATLAASRSAYTTKGHFCVFSQLANSTDGDSIGIRISSGALLSQKSAFFEIWFNYRLKAFSAKS